MLADGVLGLAVFTKAAMDDGTSPDLQLFTETACSKRLMKPTLNMCCGDAPRVTWTN